MSIDNQNFIIGLISAIALVAGLIYTFISIHKANLEIRKLQIDTQGQKKPSTKKPAHQSPNDSGKPSISIELIIDVLFFLLFSIGSINAIVEYIANRVPIFALISAQFFVMIYSLILIKPIGTSASQQNPTLQREYRSFAVVGWFGLFISIAFDVLIGIQRITPILSSLSPYNSMTAKIFSLVVNLAIAPLLAFSLVSLYRIIRHLSNISAVKQ